MKEAAMFTERFNKIMKIIGAKPADIADIIGCDRSAVDRICKGSRVPQNGGKVRQDLFRLFIRLLMNMEKQKIF